MVIQPDFKEWVELLNKHHVKYLLIGAFALAHHGAPRYTGDLDVLVEPTAENGKWVAEALAEFGFGSLGLKAVDFSTPGIVVQLGRPPVRIDIISSLTNVTWEEAWDGRSQGEFDGISVCYIGRTQFIQNKSATGRKKDLADVEALGNS